MVEKKQQAKYKKLQLIRQDEFSSKRSILQANENIIESGFSVV
jgi:hypothetical protein